MYDMGEKKKDLGQQKRPPLLRTKELPAPERLTRKARRRSQNTQRLEAQKSQPAT